jgi:hypothetical protein
MLIAIRRRASYSQSLRHGTPSHFHFIQRVALQQKKDHLIECHGPKLPLNSSFFAGQFQRKLQKRSRVCFPLDTDIALRWLKPNVPTDNATRTWPESHLNPK